MGYSTFITSLLLLIACTASTTKDERLVQGDLTFEGGIWIPESNNLKIATERCYGCYPAEPTDVPTLYFGADGFFRKFVWHLWYANKDSLIGLIPKTGQVYTGLWEQEGNTIIISYRLTHRYVGLKEIPKYKKFVIPMSFEAISKQGEQKRDSLFLATSNLESSEVRLTGQQKKYDQATRFNTALQGIFENFEKYVDEQ